MKSGLRSVALALAAPTAALIFAVIASSIFLLIAGSNPINAYGDMIEYGSQLEIQVDILNRATPLYISGVAAAIGFKMNLFNIGVEGQYRLAALFAAYMQTAEITAIDISKPIVMSGLLIGAMLPFVFSALSMKAVGKAAMSMIEEVRRQFNEIPGLREGKEGVVPDYTKCVDIATTAALKEMLLPGGLAIALPLIIGFWDKEALGGFLAGSLVTGFLLAIFMANSGGAWDNAKKYIEAGGGAGKGSDEHKAAVIGDTIGDPFKDTSGPAMNIVIKVMTIVSLIFASAF